MSGEEGTKSGGGGDVVADGSNNNGVSGGGMNNKKRKRMLGAEGTEYIEGQLANVNPNKFIPTFQKSYSLNPQNDLLGVSRTEVHISLLNKLKEKMLNIINAQPLTKERFTELLDNTFFWITFEELRVVPISIMKQNPIWIPTSYLKQIASTSSISSSSQSSTSSALVGASSASLYAEIPLEIKRQIWLFDEPLLQAEILPLIDNYCIHYVTHTSAFQLLHTVESTTFVTPQKRREKNPALQEIVKIVGKSVVLYSKLLQTIRSLYTKIPGGDASLCTLRSELLMSLHDIGLSEIYDKDPCHEFAWYFDACIRDNTIELRRIKEMQPIFDEIKPKNSEKHAMLGDLAMIICDPYAAGTLIRNIFATLIQITKRQGLPREDEGLRRMTQLLALGLDAHQMISAQQFKLPKPEKELFQTFFSELAGHIIDDEEQQKQLHLQQQQLLQQQQQQQLLQPDITPLPPIHIEKPKPSPIKSGLRNMFLKNGIARKVTLYYMLVKLQSSEIESFTNFFNLAMELKEEIGKEPMFTQSLISLLINNISTATAANTQSAKTASQNLRSLIIDGFLLQYAHVSVELLTQLISFVTHTHARFQSPQLVSLLQKLVQSSQTLLQREKEAVGETAMEEGRKNKTIRAVFKLLTDRLGSRLNERNAQFLFEFLGYPAPVVHGSSSSSNLRESGSSIDVSTTPTRPSTPGTPSTPSTPTSPTTPRPTTPTSTLTSITSPSRSSSLSPPYQG